MKSFTLIFSAIFTTVFVFADVTLINDPSFVRLTAVANPSHSLWWATDYVLEIEALNRSMLVEVSYLILDNNGTPARPSESIHVRGSNFIEGWDGTSLFQTEVGGWDSSEFQQNPKFLPLSHYQACILMLAHYEKI